MRTFTVDGRPAACTDLGDGPGSPLLLVHGWTGARDDFALVVEGLATDRRVVALDLPGHGGSEGPEDPGGYGLAALAGWVLRAADALGLDELHLLGHSLGGLVVQRAAAAASHRLRSLVLASTGLGAMPEERSEDVVRVAVAARDEGADAARAVLLDRGNDLPAGERARQEEQFAALSVGALVGTSRSLVTASPVGAFLRGIDIPVLIIHGEHDDRWGRVEQDLLARTVVGAARVVIPDARHSPQREQPERWLGAVRGFLLDVDQCTSSR